MTKMKYHLNAALEWSSGPVTIREGGKTSSGPMVLFVLLNLTSLFFYVHNPFPLLRPSPGLLIWLVFNALFFIFSLHAFAYESSSLVIDPSNRTVTESWVNVFFIKKKVCFTVDDSYFLASYLTSGGDADYYEVIDVFSADLSHRYRLDSYGPIHQLLWKTGPEESVYIKSRRTRIAAFLDIPDAGFFGLQKTSGRGPCKPDAEYGKPIGLTIPQWDVLDLEKLAQERARRRSNVKSQRGQRSI